MLDEMLLALYDTIMATESSILLANHSCKRFIELKIKHQPLKTVSIT